MTVGERLLCHALIDSTPEHLVHGLLGYIANYLAENQISEPEAPQFVPLGRKSARLLRSMLSTTMPSLGYGEDDNLEP